jgi:hypothetical protein
MEHTKAGSWERVQKLKPEDFKRLVGVRPKTFEEMVEVVRPLTNKAGKRGRSCKLSVEDMILLTLEYLRDYPTYLRLGHDWGFMNRVPVGSVKALKKHSYLQASSSYQAKSS